MGNVRRAKAGISTFIGRPVLHQISPGGYAQVQLSGGGKGRKAYVHHLVAEAFIGPRPSGMVINHMDADKTNNSLLNIEYISYRDNSLHAVAKVLRRKGPSKPKVPLIGLPKGADHWSAKYPDRVARGSRMPHSKLTPELVKNARDRIAAGEKQNALAKELGICVAQMSRIVRGKRWSYI